MLVYMWIYKFMSMCMSFSLWACILMWASSLQQTMLMGLQAYACGFVNCCEAEKLNHLGRIVLESNQHGCAFSSFHTLQLACVRDKK